MTSRSELRRMAAQNPDALIQRLEKAEQLLQSVERRAGSASHAYGFTDAPEVAEWIRAYFAEREKEGDK